MLKLVKKLLICCNCSVVKVKLQIFGVKYRDIDSKDGVNALVFGVFAINMVYIWSVVFGIKIA